MMAARIRCLAVGRPRAMAFPNAERGHGLLRAAGNDVLERWPVSRRVNSSRRQRMTRASSSAWKCSKRYRHNDVVLRAFDLLELDGDDLRRAPIEERKATLAKLLRQPVDGIAFNEHYSGDGTIIYTNPSWNALFGYREGEVVDRHVSIVTASPDEQFPGERVREIVRTIDSDGAWRGTVRDIRKDGAQFLCSETISRFEDEHFGTVWLTVHTEVSR